MCSWYLLWPIGQLPKWPILWRPPPLQGAVWDNSVRAANRVCGCIDLCRCQPQSILQEMVEPVWTIILSRHTKGHSVPEWNRSSATSSSSCTRNFRELVTPQEIRWCIHSMLVRPIALRPSSGCVDFQLGGENVIIRKVHLRSLLSWTTSGKTTPTPAPSSFHMMTHAIFFDTSSHKMHRVCGLQLPNWSLMHGIT